MAKKEITELMDEQHRMALIETLRRLGRPVTDQVRVTVTPDMARKMLATIYRNRHPSSDTVKKYARQMSSDEWLYTPESLAFDDEGKLIDGNQRLLAIVKSGRPVMTRITFGVSKNVRAVLDQGRKRAPSSAIWMSELLPDICATETDAKTVMSVSAAIARYAATSLSSPTPLELALIAEAHKSSMLWILAQKSPLLRDQHIRAALVMIHDKNHHMGEAFGKAVLDGLGLEKGSPALAVRDYLIDLKVGWTSGVAELYADKFGKILRGGKAWIQGEELNQLRRPPNVGWSKIIQWYTDGPLAFRGRCGFGDAAVFSADRNGNIMAAE